MSLRTRVALLVAVVVAVATTVVGSLAVRAARIEITEEVDNDLLERAELLLHSEEKNKRRFAGFKVWGGVGGIPGLGYLDVESPGERLRRDPLGFLVSFDAHAQVVVVRGGRDHGSIADRDMRVVMKIGEGMGFPLEAKTLERARKRGMFVKTVRGIESPLRMVTVKALDGVYVQLARSLDEAESAVDDIKGRVALFGILAVAVAAAGSWFVAGRTVRPIVRLADTAERIAETGDLERPVEASGTSEVRRLALSFRSMIDALASSRRQQRRLVMDASHELRTPLTSLRTNVDVLRRMGDLQTDDKDALLKDLDSELVELSELVAELVDLAADVHTDEGPELITPAEIADVVVERARRRTGRDIAVRIERSVPLEGRPNALARAVRNLVDNAVKFSGEGPIEVVVDGGAVTVHDAGPGITEADRQRVFDRFSRLESSQNIPGSGLGLAIVRQVAEAHNGTVSVDKSPLGGAAVGLRIPEIDAPAP